MGNLNDALQQRAEIYEKSDAAADWERAQQGDLEGIQATFVRTFPAIARDPKLYEECRDITIARLECGDRNDWNLYRETGIEVYKDHGIPLPQMEAPSEHDRVSRASFEEIRAGRIGRDEG